MCQQDTLTRNERNHILGYIRRSVTSRARKQSVSLDSTPEIMYVVLSPAVQSGVVKTLGPFFIMATQSSGHKLWHEMFRLGLGEMCPMRAVECWSSVQKGGEVSVPLHFLPQPFPSIYMILKAQHKSHRLCSHPPLTH